MTPEISTKAKHRAPSCGQEGCDCGYTIDRLLKALEPLALCQNVQHKPAEYVTRDMAIDAGEPTMEGTMLRGELSEPCLACDGCHALAVTEEVK